MCDEKKDYRYRGILRRYRKFEEHMCNAGKDRDPDICRPTFGDEWRIDGDQSMINFDNHDLGRIYNFSSSDKLCRSSRCMIILRSSDSLFWYPD